MQLNRIDMLNNADDRNVRLLCQTLKDLLLALITVRNVFSDLGNRIRDNRAVTCEQAKCFSHKTSNITGIDGCGVECE
jgi:hypothetical protein